ncbi:MAG TPA: hypothetical protein VFL27_13205, partial [Candidatus Dormibacteraeota bacterium]|nr:hypothetical protein [Candidatus Dormibacteraeota bacterium]
VVILALLTVSGLTLLGLKAHQQPDEQRFCFAEWCIAPAGITASGTTTVVHVNVRSEALSATQRPDHPQAWVDDGSGHMVGGPQSRLDRAIGPREQYAAALTFAIATTRCATFTVSEGAWPPFLGLGYAPSPFTERAAWQLCA